MFGFRKKSPVESGAAGEPERDYTVFAEGMQQFWRRRLPGAELGQDGVITVPELGLRLWQEFYQQHPQILQMVLHCNHPDFTDDLTELLVATGADPEEQLQGMADQVERLVLEPLLNALQGQNGTWEAWRLQGREHLFLACESLLMGRCKAQEIFEENVPQSSLWQRFKAEIIPYLGCKRNYWLKLYQSNFANELNCEVRINERLVPELSELLTQDAQKYAVTDWDQKQTVMLLQDTATSLDYPFSAAKVREYALQALRMFAAGQDSDTVFQRLWADCGDVSLSCDLAHYLPEICCFKCVREADTPNKTFILRSKGWADDLQLRETQIGCYDWCEQAINEFFSVDKPSRDTETQIISYGATAKAMNAAIQKGSQTKNMRFSMLFWVPDDYILR